MGLRVLCWKLGLGWDERLRSQDFLAGFGVARLALLPGPIPKQHA